MDSTTSTTHVSGQHSGNRCYRHPKRETNVSCSSCGNPICTDCMTPSPVGMRCPDCASERTRVITASQLGAEDTWRTIPLTAVLIGLNAVAFIAELLAGYPLGVFPGGVHGWVLEHGVFYGPLIAHGEWWRVVTSGFLHFGLLHIALNMYLLYVLGRMLEPAIGTLRYGLVYLAALMTGSLGTMILDPSTPAAGASGAIFGLMGLALVVAKTRGIEGAVGQIGGLIVLNLVITFSYAGISKGAHVGGLIGGVLAGLVLFELDERRNMLGRNKWSASAIIGAFAVAVFVATIALARSKFPWAVG
jgi:membrane associated rhomboid family serine protease